MGTSVMKNSRKESASREKSVQKSMILDGKNLSMLEQGLKPSCGINLNHQVLSDLAKRMWHIESFAF